MSKGFRRAAALLLGLALLLSAVPIGAAAGDAPRIYFAETPLYGDRGGLFTGVVYGGNGKPVADPTQYAIYTALSLNGSTYWPKPFLNNRFSDLYRDCSFSIATVTGGNDSKAIYFDFYLVKKSWAERHEDAERDEVAAAALDHVAVKRSEGGANVFSEERVAAKLPKPDFILPEIRSDKILVNADLRFNTEPGTPLSDEVIEAYLERVASFACGVRFFSCSAEENQTAIRLAKQKFGLFVAATAWISESQEESRAECDALCALCNEKLVDLAFVGSETLHRGDVSEEELIGYIEAVREGVENKRVAVATADTIDKFYDSGTLCLNCDVLAVNQYSYWEGVESSQCARHMINAVEGLAAKYPYKTVVVSETGFPTGGSAVGEAVPSEQNAAAYFDEVFTYAVGAKLPVFYFMASDCVYKRERSVNDGVEGYFGILDENLAIKPSFAAVEPFASCGADNRPVTSADGTREAATQPPAREKTGSALYWPAVIGGAVLIAVAAVAVALVKRKKR